MKKSWIQRNEMSSIAMPIGALKPLVRGIVPMPWQVPAKYWYSKLRGSLEDEMKILGSLACRGERVIDVGGNRGIYAYKCWKLGANVEVFEPNPACIRVLEAWAANKPRVNVYRVGLSDSSASATLHIPVDDSGVEHDASASIEHDGFARTRNQRVDLRTLDSYGFDAVSLIKIDVEGHEYKVIEGALSTIVSSMPALLVEIEQRHFERPIGEVFDKIMHLGYQGFFMAGKGLTDIEDFDLRRDQSMESFGNGGERYINNFLFLHQKRLAHGEYATLLAGRSRSIK